jgi:hypothetical protein
VQLAHEILAFNVVVVGFLAGKMQARKSVFNVDPGLMKPVMKKLRLDVQLEQNLIDCNFKSNVIASGSVINSTSSYNQHFQHRNQNRNSIVATADLVLL